MEGLEDCRSVLIEIGQGLFLICGKPLFDNGYYGIKKAMAVLLFPSYLGFTYAIWLEGDWPQIGSLAQVKTRSIKGL